MMKIDSKILSGLLAVGIYLGIIVLVFFYFGYHSRQLPKHYVAKNAKAISVSLSAPRQSHHTKKVSKTTKTKPAAKKYTHSRPKPITAKKPAPVRVAVKKRAPKKVKASSLFAHVKARPKSHPKAKAEKKRPSPQKTAPKHSGKKLDSMHKEQKARDMGIENRYLASIQDKLYGWPSQSNFAGARFTIGLTIYSDGHFDYVVIRPSDNPEFNRTIERYLKQLKSGGFDPTPHRKRYEFKVEIVAK